MSNIIDLIDDSQPDEVILLDNVEENVMQELFNNKQLSMLYQTCLNTKQCNEMMSIFKNIIMPVYKNMDEGYSKSEKFNKLVNNTNQLIIRNPKQTYSHVKGFIEILKLHKSKKKGNFVTLARNLKGNNPEKGEKRKPDWLLYNNKKITTVINLDNYESPIVVLDDDDDVVCLNNAIKSKTNADCPQTKSLSNSTNLNTSNVTENGFNPNISNEENPLLIQRTDVCDDSEDFEIHRLERLMAKFREKIIQLEKREILNYDGKSPYILCQKYKITLVKLYKKWCEIMGTECVRSKKITLKVQDGHPPGPVRRLEEFLNNNTGSDGCPLFPDFDDVVECVLKSNRQDGLSWNKARVMREATALFTQCGRALQKRRKKQEWYNLMSIVEEEDCLVDPADTDPELEARLQQNKRRAVLKESKIMKRFSLLQDATSRDKNNGESSDTLTRDIGDSIKPMDTKVEPNIEVKQECIDIVKQLEELGDNYTAVVQDIEDPFLVVEISDTSDEE